MRARLIAEKYFDSPTEVAKKREFWSYRGKYKGVPVGVCSTGIGCPSAAITLEELIRVGSKVFVRVGTAGAIDTQLRAGDLVVLTGAVRDDGTSKQYVPVEYPAVADHTLISALMRAAEARGVRYMMGIGHSKDAFYSEYPDMMASPEAMEMRWKALKRAGVIATEMESAALYVIGQLRGVRVATVCEIVGEPVENEAKILDRPRLDDLVHVALDAMTSVEL